MKQFKLLHTLMGWGVFGFTFVIYLLTLEPSVSFWDCGEFISSSFKLQVGHPPGAPFFQIVQRVFSLFAPNVSKVAFMMNAFSALTSAATILFLFWTIFLLAERIQGTSTSKGQAILANVAAAIGALTFAFTDSFWFSAVEAEVYAFSSLFTAVVFWAILKWEKEAEQPYSNRWIVLIAYLVGLSIGVHLLNLLAIPAIALIWYFKKYKPTTKGIVYTMVFSFVAILLIMYGIVQGTPNVAQSFEILFVNTFGLPYNSGLIFFLVLLAGGLGYLAFYSHKKKKALLNLAVLSVAVIYLGFGSYAMLMIRSSANPPMDENNPENAYTLMKYLNRSQYGTTPIVSGYYYNAPSVGVEKGKPVYYPKEGKYIKIEGQPEYKFDNRFKTIFPRMHSQQENHEQGYQMWANIKGRKVNVNGETLQIPTFSENLRFFFSYQFNHMYLRYFMWNFAGRQNDNQGHGDVFNGNWLTGIGFIDNMRLGHNGNQPSAMSNPKTTNRYFMLPLLLGLMGAFFHFKQSKKDFWVVLLLFIMTGIAIVVYLNQPPFQPRERDYAYAGSFYAFAIWIGLGVMALSKWTEKYLKQKTLVVATVVSAIVPLIVLAENYDDHDRSGRYIARDMGKNYLNSCEKNSVLFTLGDNDTFPLWYVQDVENCRPDVRICCVTLMNGDWYIDQMKKKVYSSEPLPILMAQDRYENNERNVVLINDDFKRPVELSSLLKIVLSDDPRTKVQTQGGAFYNYLPTRQIKITVDKAQVLKTGTVPADKADQIADSMIIDVKGNYISKSDLAVLDILANNNWQRPLYFDLSVINTLPLDLEPYLQNEGFAFRLMPLKNETGKPWVNTTILANRLMKQFTWGNMNNPKICVDNNLLHTIEVLRIKENFNLLAENFLREGNHQMAKQAIDKVYQVLPLTLYSTGYDDILLAKSYIDANALTEGDKLFEAVANNCLDKIAFYLSLNKEYIGNFQRTISREISLAYEVAKVADEAGRKQVSESINTKIKGIAAKYEKGK